MSSYPILIIFSVLKASTVDAFKTSKITKIGSELIKWEHQTRKVIERLLKVATGVVPKEINAYMNMVIEIPA